MFVPNLKFLEGCAVNQNSLPRFLVSINYSENMADLLKESKGQHVICFS